MRRTSGWRAALTLALVVAGTASEELPPPNKVPTPPAPAAEKGGREQPAPEEVPIRYPLNPFPPPAPPVVDPRTGAWQQVWGGASEGVPLGPGRKPGLLGRLLHVGRKHGPCPAPAPAGAVPALPVEDIPAPLQAPVGQSPPDRGAPPK